MRLQPKIIPDIVLSNGVKMPAIGFGVAALGNGSIFNKAMDNAFVNGYRMFDTAPFYDNGWMIGQTCSSQRYV